MPFPRGYRQNNPGNIRKGAVAWQGEIRPGIDPAFCQFSDPKYGLRALMVLFKRYYYIRDLTTVQQIINTWAPPTENNTTSYINDVAFQMDVKPQENIFMCPEAYIAFAKAVTHHENGIAPITYPQFWYSDDVYRAAYSLMTPQPNASQAT